MRQVIISHEVPAIYDALNAQFGADWDKGLIIAYDGVIHSKGEVPPHKVVHECVHLDEQDEIGNDAWWRLYLEDRSFRREQELKAAKAEMDFLKKNIKDRNHLAMFRLDLAKGLASSMYGELFDEREVYKLLK